MPGLHYDHISHAYEGKPVVKDVDLRLEQGEVMCLLGPSGCGKSTLLRIAAGLEPLQQGQVIIDGKVVANAKTWIPPEERKVGLVFQDYALFPHLSVVDNICFGLAKKLPQSEKVSFAGKLLKRVGLLHHLDSFPHTLSGGEMQRVALVRAMATRPRLVLLDEPFSGLDVRLRDQIRDDTVKLLKEEGTTALMVTHDPDEAMRMGDRIAIMRDGNIVQMGTAADLYDRPVDAFVARFLGEVNEIEGVIKDGRAVTPIGSVKAEHRAEGESVSVLFRHEGVYIGDQGIGAKVLYSRVLGPYSLVSLAIEGRDRPIIARLGNTTPPEAGATVGISVNPTKAYVFDPAEISL